MADCIFCKIIAGEIPASKVFEDETVVAFLDINPVVAGHTLIIPKQHVATMADASNEVIADVFSKAKKLMVGIKKAMNADFVAVSIVGVDVPHFHVHLIPRSHDDGLANFWPTKKYGAGEIEALAVKIKSLLF